MNPQPHGSGLSRIALSVFASCALVLAGPLVAHAQSPAASGTVITIAGNGTNGFSGDGGAATNASLGEPSGLAIGPDGTLYFADNGNNRFRAIAPATGLITTIAGTGTHGDTGNGGPATNATFHGVASVAVDRARHALYLTDFGKDWVRKMNLTNGLLTRFAGTGNIGSGGDGGPATSAQFAFSAFICTDGTGRLSIADEFNYRVRQVNPVTGIITTIAGNGNTFSAGDGGPATNASITQPGRVAADRAGNVFVLDQVGSFPAYAYRIRRIDAVSGIITTVAGGGTNTPGSGPATNMNLGDVRGLAVSDAGKLFIANIWQVFRVDLATGQLTPFAGDGTDGFSGDGGPALNARFSNISGLTLAPGGGLLISDTLNLRIRYVVPDSINLTNDSAQTAFHLPWVSALTNLTIANNPNLTVISMGSLVTVSGDLNIGGNTSAVVINMGSATTVGGDLIISGNTAADPINMGAVTTVGGSLDISGNTNAGAINMGSTTTVGGSVTISGNTAADPIDMGALTTVSGDLTITSNAPNVTVNLSRLSRFGAGTNATTITLQGGTFVFTNSLTIASNATLAGAGTLAGTVTNAGKLAPGRSPGRFDITGHLVLTGSSELRLELGGYTPGTQFDFLNVVGNVTLGGTLAVSLINNFPSVMTNGASFTILTAGSPLTGTFANVASGATLTTTDGYARFTVLYAGETMLRLTNLVIVDTDSDGLPDWWEDQFSLNKTNAADAALDADGDGASNVNEFRAGTVPNNAASVFRVVSIARETNSVRLTWSTVGGKSYYVQTNGSLTTNFADLSSLITVPGTGESTTNIATPGAATNPPAGYYRVRLGP